MERCKTVYLGESSEEGIHWRLRVKISVTTKKFSGYFTLSDSVDKEKRLIRMSDKVWIAHNIPSSIWWRLENHHDWKNGARLYLLTKEEHKKRTRDERNKERA